MLLLAIAISKLARTAVRRMERRLEGASSSTQELTLHRTATLTHSLSSAARAIIWGLVALLVLGEVGFNLAPLLAGAGIAGVALGFGAQSLARDFLSGFFILLENQFGVGHVVDVQSTGGMVSGKVETLTLRITSIRAFDGTLHIIPNGNIQVVGNKSRGWARAIVDVTVPPEDDLDGTRRVLEDLLDETRQDPELRDALLSDPAVLGVETMADSQVVLRVVVQTRPSKRAGVERGLRERIKRRLDEQRTSSTGLRSEAGSAR